MVQPYCKALQHCKDDIICTVTFNDIKDELITRRIITPDELEWLQKVDSQTAIKYVVTKLMHSTNTLYIKFLEVLSVMEQLKYIELRERIISEYQRILVDPAIPTADDGDRNTLSSNENSYSESLREVVRHSCALADTVVKEQTVLQPVTQSIKLKAVVGKTFTDFLLYLCDIFLKAIKDKNLRLTSDPQNTEVDLNDTVMILMSIREKFHNTYRDQEEKEDSLRYALPILIFRANKLAGIIRNIWQPFWKRWSTNRISSLLPIYHGIVQVVKGITDIDCRPFCELIGDITQLKACLISIDTIVKALYHSQVVASITLGASATICMILALVLLPTPAAIASVPLLITGGVLTWQTSVQIGFVIMTREVISGAIDQSKENGLHSGKEFMKKVDELKTGDAQQHVQQQQQ